MMDDMPGMTMMRGMGMATCWCWWSSCSRSDLIAAYVVELTAELPILTPLSAFRVSRRRDYLRPINATGSTASASASLSNTSTVGAFSSRSSIPM